MVESEEVDSDKENQGAAKSASCEDQQVTEGRVSNSKIAEFFKSSSRKSTAIELLMSPPTSTAILPQADNVGEYEQNQTQAQVLDFVYINKGNPLEVQDTPEFRS